MPKVTQRMLDRLQGEPEAIDEHHFFNKLPANPQKSKHERTRFVTFGALAALVGVQLKTIRANTRKKLKAALAGPASIDIDHPDARAYLEHRGVKAPPEEPDEAVVSAWFAEDRTVARQQLRWFFTQAGSELGEKSAWESLCFAAIVGGGMNGAAVEPFQGGVSARTPDVWRLAAAQLYGRIAAGLARIGAGHQSILEMKFSLRKPNPQIRGMLHAHGHEGLEPVVTYLHRSGRVSFKADGSGAEIASVIEFADGALKAALAAYEQAAGLVPSESPKTRGPAKQRKRLDLRLKPSQPALLIARGRKGASSRQLTAAAAE